MLLASEVFSWVEKSRTAASNNAVFIVTNSGIRYWTTAPAVRQRPAGSRHPHRQASSRLCIPRTACNNLSKCFSQLCTSAGLPNLSFSKSTGESFMETSVLSPDSLFSTSVLLSLRSEGSRGGISAPLNPLEGEAHQQPTRTAVMRFTYGGKTTLRVTYARPLRKKPSSQAI